LLTAPATATCVTPVGCRDEQLLKKKKKASIFIFSVSACSLALRNPSAHQISRESKKGKFDCSWSSANLESLAKFRKKAMNILKKKPSAKGHAFNESLILSLILENRLPNAWSGGVYLEFWEALGTGLWKYPTFRVLGTESDGGFFVFQRRWGRARGKCRLPREVRILFL